MDDDRPVEEAIVAEARSAAGLALARTRMSRGIVASYALEILANALDEAYPGDASRPGVVFASLGDQPSDPERGGGRYYASVVRYVRTRDDKRVVCAVRHDEPAGCLVSLLETWASIAQMNLRDPVASRVAVRVQSQLAVVASR